MKHVFLGFLLIGNTVFADNARGYYPIILEQANEQAMLDGAYYITRDHEGRLTCGMIQNTQRMHGFYFEQAVKAINSDLARKYLALAVIDEKYRAAWDQIRTSYDQETNVFRRFMQGGKKSAAWRDWLSSSASLAAARRSLFCSDVYASHMKQVENDLLMRGILSESVTVQSSSFLRRIRQHPMISAQDAGSCKDVAQNPLMNGKDVPIWHYAPSVDILRVLKVNMAVGHKLLEDQKMHAMVMRRHRSRMQGALNIWVRDDISVQEVEQELSAK